MFQSARDKEKERAAARQITQLWGWKSVEFPDFSVADFIFYSSKRLVWAEVKCRPITFDQWAPRGIYLAHRKFKRLRHLSTLQRIPAWLFYGFSDGIRWLDIGKFLRPRRKSDTEWGLIDLDGRMDRANHAHGIELVLKVPKTMIEPLPQSGDDLPERLAETPEAEHRAFNRQEYFRRLRERQEML